VFDCEDIGFLSIGGLSGFVFSFEGDDDNDDDDVVVVVVPKVDDRFELDIDIEFVGMGCGFVCIVVVESTALGRGVFEEFKFIFFGGGGDSDPLTPIVVLLLCGAYHSTKVSFSTVLNSTNTIKTYLRTDC
jgi:hypothetical protein